MMTAEHPVGEVPLVGPALEDAEMQRKIMKAAESARAAQESMYSGNRIIAVMSDKPSRLFTWQNAGYAGISVIRN